MEESAATLDYEWWDWLFGLLKTVVTVVTLLFGSWIAHWFWRRQKTIEQKIKRDEAVTAAIKAAWQFLEYLTEREYPNTIIVDRGTKEKSYQVLRLDKAMEFITQVPRVLYQEGHGIILPNEIEDDLMALRGKFHTFIEREFHRDQNKKASPDSEEYGKHEGYFQWIKERSEKSVRVKNPKYAKDVHDRAQNLRIKLKKFLSKYA